MIIRWGKLPTGPKRTDMKSRALAWLLVVLLVICAPLAYAQTTDKADVRILIDISGSMKKNDPKNLRRPALRLLVGLLPEDTRAGVWTFGQYVNMLIPLGKIDDAWRQKARESAAKISSPGQYTNIEGVLDSSTRDWTGPPTQFRRSIILLTDGMVDISKSKARNQASRQAILDSLLPKLKQLGVSVHTIALSKNADEELMRELSESTGGWYEQVDSAGELQKVFLRIFEKVGKPDAVPLKDNKFTIDDSITEATVLVFHRPDAEPTQLVNPQGETFGSDNAPANVSWHRDEGFDMLTIGDPQSGEWKIRAEQDPDNRVIVVTDLKMRTTELPNRLIQGVSIPFEVSFTDHGNLISKPSFLKVVNVIASREDAQGLSEPRPVLDDGRGDDNLPGDGIFTFSFGGEALGPGVGELIIEASGRTFNRQQRLSYEIVPPVEVLAQPSDRSGILSVAMTAKDKWIDPAQLEVFAWLEDSEGQQFPLELNVGEDGVRNGEIDINGFAGARAVFVKASGKTRDGVAVSYFDSPLEVEGLQIAPIPPPEPEPEPEPQAVPEPEPEPVEPPPEPESWLWTGIIIGVVNLILVAGVVLVIWWLRRRERNALVNLAENEEQTVEPPKEEAS